MDKNRGAHFLRGAGLEPAMIRRTGKGLSPFHPFILSLAARRLKRGLDVRSQWYLAWRMDYESCRWSSTGRPDLARGVPSIFRRFDDGLFTYR